MAVTQEQIDEIVRLNKEKHNDADIAERLELPYITVRYWRRKIGLKPVRKFRETMRKKYEVYDAKTALLVVAGTVDECAQVMGITVGHFYTARAKFERGVYKKYEIYEVEET